MATLDTLSGIELEGRATPRHDWIDLVVALASRRRTLLAVLVLAASGSTVAVLLLPDSYTARTTILPPQQSQSLASAMMGQLGPLAALGGRDLGVRNVADLYAGILQSDSLAAELIRRYRLIDRYGVARHSDARQKLARRTVVTVRPKDGLIDIEVEDREPQTAADLANSYVELLFGVNSRLALTEASQRRLFFEGELNAAKESLARAETTLKHTQESTGMVQLDSQARGLVQAVAGVKAEIAAKEVQLRAMNTFATERNHAVVIASEELAGLRSQLERMQARGGGAGDIEIATRRVPETSLAYMRSLRDLAFQEALYELLAKQYEAARIDEAKSAPVIQVVDKALPPDHRSGPPRLLYAAGATAGCAFAALLLVAVAGRWRAAAADPETSRRLAQAFGRTR
jgi:tyrosine-protein kinase Etk/Wzc